MTPASQLAGIKQTCCDQICFPHVAAVSSEAVTPGSAVVQQLVTPAQSALLTTPITAPAPQVQFSTIFSIISYNRFLDFFTVCLQTG